MSHRYKKTAGLLMAVFLLVLDRFLKMLALSRPEQTLDLLGPWLGFRLVRNHYISLSLPIGGPVAIILAALIIIGLLVYIFRSHRNFSPRDSLGWGLILAGALSNLFDRLVYGFVIDYLDWRYLFVNNLADIMIFMGIIVVITNKLDKKDI